MMRMMKGRLPLALLGNDRLVQGAWCVGFADIPRFRLAVPTPNLIPRRWRTEPNHRRHGVPCWRRRLRDLLPLIALSQPIQHRRPPRPGAAYVGGFFTHGLPSVVYV
jgi:hypothetical protein